MGVGTVERKNEKIAGGVRKLKICFLAPHLSDCGGVQRVAAIIANGMAQKNDVTIITVNNEKKTSFYELDRKITFINYNNFRKEKTKLVEKIIRKAAQKCNFILPVSLARYAYYPQYTCAGLTNLLKQGKYECIIALTAEYTIFLAIMAKEIKGSRLIGWHHNSFKIYFQTPGHGFYVQKKLAEKVLGRLDELVTLTEHDSQEYKKQMGLDCKYIYNPLSFFCTRKADMSEKVLLFVGRLEREQKGTDMLIDIAEELFHRRQCNGWKLRIVGGGSGYEEVRQQILYYGLEDYVELLGEKSDVQDYYVNASLFLCTSRWEGFGLVITEAMECGLPVVSFRTDGPSEIIFQGENGYLVDNFNIKEFADAVEKLMNDKSLRIKMSDNAALRAKDFHLDKILQDWERIIKG